MWRNIGVMTQRTLYFPLPIFYDEDFIQTIIIIIIIISSSSSSSSSSSFFLTAISKV